VSGSGGTTSRTRRTGDGGDGGAACATLAFEATVATPDPAVVGVTAVGDLCDVVVAGRPPQVMLLLKVGYQLGALTDHWADLTRCIADGYEYEAEVIALTPVVRVHVYPRPR
jgi:hypothetical protein